MKPISDTKLISVVLYVKRQHAEIKVLDPDGKLRKVDQIWKSKDPIPLIANWWQEVLEEVQVQREYEAEVAKGRMRF